MAIFVLAPLGTLLLNRTLKRATAIAVALSVGGASAGVYAGGFVAEPVSDGTVGYVVAASVTGLVALVADLLVVRPFPGPAAIARRERVRAELLRRVTVEQEQAREAAGARASGRAATAGAPSDRASSAERPGSGAADDPVVGLRDLLVHGFAIADQGREGPTGDLDGPTRAHVARLLDLHERGVLDDDDLALALDVLRSGDETV